MWRAAIAETSPLCPAPTWVDASRRGRIHGCDDERHAERSLVCEEAVRHLAVISERFTVIGRDDG